MKNKSLKVFVSQVVFLFFICFFTINTFAESRKIIISEFMAINSNIIEDEDGDNSDWLELYNTGENPIDLAGWFLTDNPENLEKWEIPSITLNAGEYKLIFASEKKRDDPANNLHTNFKLSGSGEFLAIVEPDGTISHSFGDSYPAQQSDVSYGIYQDQEVYFSTPTPGVENVAGSLPFAPNFSVTRGFYNTGFDVSLSTPGTGSTIYYTLDGTQPDINSGQVYSSPVHIDQTTPLSAIAISSSGQSSDIVTHTYWFISDILLQPESPEGYPMDWKMASSSTSIPADYEMDTEVCTSPEYAGLMEEALTNIPSMSIVTTRGYLFNDVSDEDNGGIYIYTGKPSGEGADWVRPTSIEYYDPSTGKEFQTNCRLKLHGGNSRNPSNSAKHGFELTFSSDYGPSKLNFNLFDEDGAENEFNNLVLRAGYNYTWLKNNETQRLYAQYIQDSWAKTTQLDMGKTSAHERFVHLYINGLYWGLYNISEKYTNDFFESYMKGDEDDFDIVKEKQVVTTGNLDAFNALVAQMNSSLSNNANYQKIQGKNPDGTENSSYQNLLDMNNYIDYMLINYYVANLDWNKNNWVMARNRETNEAGFRFLCWDVETCMTDVSRDLVSEIGDDKNPMSFVEYLKGNEDFKMLFADEIQKHMIASGGALTPEEVAKRYEELASEIDLPIIGESARWGDYRRDVAPSDAGLNLYTRNDYWLPRKQDLLDNYFPYRTDIVIEQLRDKGLFTDIEAPVFSHEGGNYESSINLEIYASSGDIYYTTDGSDPREQITSNVSTEAQTYSNSIPVSAKTTVKARAKSGNDWSPLTEAKYKFGEIDAFIELADYRKLEHGNYPNPFTVSTQIYYNLPADGNIEINVFGIDGRKVSKLYNGYQLKGKNSVKWEASNLRPGIYIYHIQYNNQLYSGKLIHN